MNPKTTTSYILSIVSLLSLSIPTNARSSNITAVFAFGDSTVDSGNNNHIPTIVQSNHPPYGQDFPKKIATGRFCNGKLTTDYIVSFLGLKDILPAYLDPSVTDSDLLTGVSFASAGTGLDDSTADTTHVLHMETELNYFDEAVRRIKKILGEEEANRVINNALFVISVGTNDMLFNFYNIPTRKFIFSASGYHDFLLNKLENFIQRLYDAGARRFAVAGLPPIGCLPFQVTLHSILPSKTMLRRVCVDRQNNDSQLYNQKLLTLTSKLQAKLQSAKVMYFDIYNPIMDVITNPAKYGFEQKLLGCCGTGLIETGPLCQFVTPMCMDASKFLFWDSVHLTQAGYSILANAFGKNVLPRFIG